MDLNAEFALRDPPALAVDLPLPSDLAHALTVEFEGVEGRYAAGEVLLSGQGMREPGPAGVRSSPSARSAASPTTPSTARGRAGSRAILTADPDRGWADPDIRSIAPGTFATEWTEARIVRR